VAPKIDYNNGQSVIGTGASTAVLTCASDNTAVATATSTRLTTSGVVYCLVALTGASNPTTATLANISATYTKDSVGYNFSVALNVVDGDSAGLNVTPSSATIALGNPAEVSVIADFDGVTGFNVGNICTAPAVGDTNPVIYSNWCPYGTGTRSIDTTGYNSTYYAAPASSTDAAVTIPPTILWKATTTLKTPTGTTANIPFKFKDYNATEKTATFYGTVTDKVLESCEIRDSSGVAIPTANNDTYASGQTDLRFRIWCTYSEGVAAECPSTLLPTWSASEPTKIIFSTVATENGWFDTAGTGTGIIVTADAGGGITCSEVVKVQQQTLACITVVPYHRDLTGGADNRAAYCKHDGGTGKMCTADGLPGAGNVEKVLIPNVTGLKTRFKAKAWFPTAGNTCSCPTSFTNCFAVDVTASSTWSIVPNFTSYPALSLTTTGASPVEVTTIEKTTATYENRKDRVNASYTLNAVTKTDYLEVAVCGRRVTASPGDRYDIHSVFSDDYDNPANSVAASSVYLGGTSYYYFTDVFDSTSATVTCGFTGTGWPTRYYVYDLSLDSNWNVVNAAKASVAYGKITGLEEGNTDVTCNYGGGANEQLNVSVLAPVVSTCEYTLSDWAPLFNDDTSSYPVLQELYGTSRFEVTGTLSDLTVESLTPSVSGANSGLDGFRCRDTGTAPTVTIKCLKGDGTLVTRTGAGVAGTLTIDMTGAGTPFDEPAAPTSVLNYKTSSINTDSALAATTSDTIATVKCEDCGYTSGAAVDVTCTAKAGDSTTVEATLATVSSVKIVPPGYTCFDATTPDTVYVLKSTTMNMKLCVYYNNGAIAELDYSGDTGGAWSGGGVVTVSSSLGTVTGNSAGTATVTGGFGGKNDTITVNVVDDSFSAIDITGNNVGGTDCNALTGTPDICEIESTNTSYSVVGTFANTAYGTQDLSGTVKWGCSAVSGGTVTDCADVGAAVTPVAGSTAVSATKTITVGAALFAGTAADAGRVVAISGSDGNNGVFTIPGACTSTTVCVLTEDPGTDADGGFLVTLVNENFRKHGLLTVAAVAALEKVTVTAILSGFTSAADQTAVLHVLNEGVLANNLTVTKSGTALTTFTVAAGTAVRLQAIGLSATNGISIDATANLACTLDNLRVGNLYNIASFATANANEEWYGGWLLAGPTVGPAGTITCTHPSYGAGTETVTVTVN
ncbi:MAG: hypothetical protein V1754_04405, partial [Pseudomonadota bacterium]